MRPIQSLFVLSLSGALWACAAEPDSLVEAGSEEDVLDAIDDDGVSQPGDSGEGELPPPIVMPPGIEGGESIEELVAAGRDERLAACTSTCDGVYQRHGSLPYEWCLCRTVDAGERCESGSDCEGDCIYVGLDATGGGMGVPYGECAEFEQVFGCYSYLPETSEGLVPVDGYSPLAICID